MFNSPKMKIKIIFFVFFVSTSILTGCKMNMAMELFISDILKTTNLTKPGPVVKAPAKLTIETFATPKECNEYAKTISNNMKNMEIEFTSKGCNYLLRADTRIPLLYGNEAWKQSNSLFGVVLSKDANGNILSHLTMDRAKFRILNEKISKEYHQNLELSKSRVSISLNNDMPGMVKYVVYGSFLNERPIIIPEGYNNLNYRGKAEIVLSNVAIAHLEKIGSVIILRIGKIES